MDLSVLLDEYPLVSADKNLPKQITGFCADSRSIRPGFLFICIRGQETDGHQYIREAIAKGALIIAAESAIEAACARIIVSDTRHFLSFVADRFYRQPSSQLRITGITGTNGKTTTAHFLYEIYKAAGYKSALMGTAGVKTNGEYRSQLLTTPGPEELHLTLWQLARNNYQHVAMEVSSHALVQKRVEHCRFHAAVFTNLTREHLDYHRTMDEYFRAKAHLFSLLPDTAHAVLNSDDPYTASLAKTLKTPVITFGMSKSADVQVKDITVLTKGGYYVTTRSPWGEIAFVVHLRGTYNLYNALAAAATALADNLNPHDVMNGLESLQGVPGRLEQLDFPRGVTVFLDYAHTPDGLQNVLETIKALPHKRIILVFGCRGRRDRGKRPLMGRIAAFYADEVILTSDNPQNENPRQIAAEITSGMPKKPKYIEDRHQAIHYALDQAVTGDIVLITGKGREDYQLIGDITVAYSDSYAVSSYLDNHPH